MNIIKFFILSTVLIRSAFGDSVDNPDDPFSSWENVPELINSLQLEQLQRATLIKLGYPQATQGLSDTEHQLYMIQTKERWREWWKSTGEEISKAKKTGARIDHEAFNMAWEFLGKNQEQPKIIPPVWIPETWTLSVTFSNGDYMGREKEVWMIHRESSGVSLTKLRGDYSKNGRDWNVVLTKFDGLTPEQADQTLKALCYLHHHAPAAGTKVPKNELEKLYYPHATLHLRDGSNRIIWNTDGYKFCKTRPEHGIGEAGRSYYFLKTVFSDHERWKNLSTPTSEEFAPYRSLLSASKPYFFTNAADIIQLFGRDGGHLEKEAMLAWAANQKSATNAKIDWKVRSSDFSTEMKVNVISLTQIELEETLKQIKTVENRLAKEGDNRQGKQPADGKPSND